MSTIDTSKVATSNRTDAATTSTKDAFLSCLMEPPASSSEKDLLARTRGVSYGGAVVEDETANVRRFDEAVRGFAVLDPAWIARVEGLTEPAHLGRFEGELSSALAIWPTLVTGEALSNAKRALACAGISENSRCPSGMRKRPSGPTLRPC